jgi:hypothetical protein
MTRSALKPKASQVAERRGSLGPVKFLPGEPTEDWVHVPQTTRQLPSW